MAPSTSSPPPPPPPRPPARPAPPRALLAALALFSLALLPFFIWLTKRVGAERKRITSEKQGRLADMSALVEESRNRSPVHDVITDRVPVDVRIDVA